VRIVLFDLGNTLLDDSDRPFPDAIATLETVGRLRDADGRPAAVGLVSDWESPDRPEEIPAARERYYRILRQAGLERFFTPLEQRVTLSTDVGVGKPDPRIFRAAIAKLDPGASLHHAVFITENAAHVAAARRLGLTAIHLDAAGEVRRLADLVPVLQRLVAFAPCDKKPAGAAGRYASVSSKSKRQDVEIQALTARVSAARLGQRIDALAAFGTRWTHAPGVARVPEWLHGEFLALGYSATQTRYQEFTLPGGQRQRNVLCGPGQDHPGFVLLCAHYDSLSETPDTLAPGADDNASGVAVLLEAAALLREAPLRRGILYAAFGGEEQGLFGSAGCAEVAAREGWRIDVVVNLDMVAYQSAAKPGHIVVEYDQGNRHPGNDAAAKAYGLLMAQAAADYSTLTVEHTDIWNSDYMPFEALGYPCIGVFEASENPGYHMTTDVASVLDTNHLAEVARMVVATLCLIAR
jgi:FMN phosphatase YigB (HAD superfamily)